MAIIKSNKIYSLIQSFSLIEVVLSIVILGIVIVGTIPIAKLSTQAFEISNYDFQTDFSNLIQIIRHNESTSKMPQKFYSDNNITPSRATSIANTQTNYQEQSGALKVWILNIPGNEIWQIH